MDDLHGNVAMKEHPCLLKVEAPVMDSTTTAAFIAGVSSIDTGSQQAVPIVPPVSPVGLCPTDRLKHVSSPTFLSPFPGTSEIPLCSSLNLVGTVACEVAPSPSGLSAKSGNGSCQPIPTPTLPHDSSDYQLESSMQRPGMDGRFSSPSVATLPGSSYPSLRKCKKQARRSSKGCVSTHPLAGKQKVSRVQPIDIQGAV